MPTCAPDRCSTGLADSAPDRDPTIVTSSPSRIQAMPSAVTTSQWKRLHGRRSSRAGTSVSNTTSGGGGAFGVAVIAALCCHGPEHTHHGDGNGRLPGRNGVDDCAMARRGGTERAGPADGGGPDQHHRRVRGTARDAEIRG